MANIRKTNLTVEDFEDKKFGEGKTAGRYTRFKTDQGWISSFDKPTIEKLKDAEGKCVSVEIATDKNDKEKITKFLGDASEDEVSDVIGETTEDDIEVVKIGSARKSVKGSNYEKDPVGLAVELCVAIMMSPNTTTANANAVMATAIDLVKQAQKAFEQ